jgi:hypothetical protein
MTHRDAQPEAVAADRRVMFRPSVDQKTQEEVSSLPFAGEGTTADNERPSAAAHCGRCRCKAIIHYALESGTWAVDGSHLPAAV